MRKKEQEFKHEIKRDVMKAWSHCLAFLLSEAMEQWKIRRWSCPFDWIFSSPDMVTHCLADDFSAFLDVDQYFPAASNKALYERM